MEDLKNQFDQLVQEFNENFNKVSTKGNKAAARRARKALNDLRLLSTPFRKAISETVNAEA